MAFKKLTDEEKAARAAAKLSLSAPAIDPEVPLDEPEAEGSLTDVKEPEKEPTDFMKPLSKTELETITNNAKKKVRKELREKEIQAFMDAEVARLRLEAGVGKPGLGGHLDELVTFRCDLGDQSDNTADPYMQVNIPDGAKYYHGHVYTVPRHVFNSLNEQMWRLQMHNLAKDGKSVFRNRKKNAVLNADGSSQNLYGEIH